MTPLYNHTSFETSYLVPDYPYGRKVRCEIRFWIEFKESKGYRFCHKTKNPKTDSWDTNAQKNSNYYTLAMCLYLDEKDYVTYSALTEWSKPTDIKAFVENFPEAVTDRLRNYVKQHKAYSSVMAKKLNLSEDEKAKYLVEAASYAEIFP